MHGWFIYFRYRLFFFFDFRRPFETHGFLDLCFEILIFLMGSKRKARVVSICKFIQKHSIRISRIIISRNIWPNNIS
jgi:hypothetical protein